MLGEAGGPVETAWVDRPGDAPRRACGLRRHGDAGHAVRPFTLFVNKAAIEGERHATLTWGAAQAGVAAGVMDAVAEGTSPEARGAAHCSSSPPCG